MEYSSPDLNISSTEITCKDYVIMGSFYTMTDMAISFKSDCKISQEEIQLGFSKFQVLDLLMSKRQLLHIYI